MADPLGAEATDGPWRHRYVAANGARFHAVVADPEPSDAPLVLLLHGFPQFWWTWRHQLPALAEAGYRAVAMDLRGYGASDKPPRGYDPTTLALDVAGLIRSLGADRAVLVGHDWGGLLAWTTAVLHPELVRGLATVGAAHPRPLRASLVREPARWSAARHLIGFQAPWRPERQLVADDAAAIAELLSRWSYGEWPDPDTAEVYRRAFAIPGVAHSSLEYFRWAVRSLPRPDGIRYQRRMSRPATAPLLQMYGAADPLLSAATLVASTRFTTGDHQTVRLPDAGHYPQEETPAAVNAELVRWLVGLSGR